MLVWDFRDCWNGISRGMVLNTPNIRRPTAATNQETTTKSMMGSESEGAKMKSPLNRKIF